MPVLKMKSKNNVHGHILLSACEVGVGVVPLDDEVAVAVAWGSPVTLFTFNPGTTCPLNIIWPVGDNILWRSFSNTRKSSCLVPSY